MQLSLVQAGGGKTRHFYVSPGARLRLVGLNLVNGFVGGTDGAEGQNGADAMGGAIYNDNGVLELVNCTFSRNRVRGGKGGDSWADLTAGGAAKGGAVYSDGGRMRVMNCRFSADSCKGGARGVYSGLYTGSGGDASGGTIFCTGTDVEISQSRITSSSAIGGGQAPSQPPLRPAGAGGSAYGGAIAIQGASASMDACEVADCTAQANLRVGLLETGSALGGGLFHDGGEMTVANSSFTNNTAVGGPGAGLEFHSGGSGKGAPFSICPESWW